MNRGSEYRYYEDLERISIARFIEETQTKPTPLPMYAAWLCAWRRDRGRVSNWLNNYEAAELLTPTIATPASIPWSSQLNLLIIPSLAVVGDVLTATEQDRRKWGGTTVKLLKRAATPQKKQIVDAMTNNLTQVFTCPEVEAFIKNYDGGSQALIRDCAASVLKVMRGQNAGTSLFQLPAA